MTMTRPRRLTGAGALKLGVLALQLVVVLTFVQGLLGGDSAMPKLGEPLAFFTWTGLITSLLVLLLLGISTRGGSLALWARILGWQTGVGALLAFTIAMAFIQDKETVSIITVGLWLLLPGTGGIAFALMADRQERLLKQEAEAQQRREHQQLLAALTAVTEQLATIPRRRRCVFRGRGAEQQTMTQEPLRSAIEPLRGPH
jgi:hypothetical protein